MGKPDQPACLVRPRQPGYLSNQSDESGSENTRCQALNEDVLYIRILTFYKIHTAQDAQKLQECFASGDFQKVIFDVRGNQAGEVWSYMDNIIAPLIRQPISFEMTSAVKDSFNDWYGWRFKLFQATTSNELTDPPASLSRSDLLRDEWIQWVLQDQP